MPNRILRDWTDSESVDQLSADAERFFTRLIMKVDDYGRYPANPQLMKSNLYPLKSDIRVTDISLWLAACKKNGLITTYLVATKEFLQIENFRQRLRIMESKYPPPTNDGQVTDMCQTHDGLKRNETKRKRNETNARATPGKYGNQVLYDLPDLQEKLESDEIWIEVSAKNLGAEISKVKSTIGDYINHIASQGTEQKEMKDAKAHFNSWFMKRYSNQNSNGKFGTKQNDRTAKNADQLSRIVGNKF